MQDPNAFQSMKPQFPPEHEQLKCPRCESTNTKFCYYNNYNLSQPRHFCKNCRRYWTKGGALRNIPVGGGSRKNKQRPNLKRSTSSSSSSSSSSIPQPIPKPEPMGMIYPPTTVIDPDHQMLDITGSFSSLLASNGQFGNLMEGMNSTGSSVQRVQFSDFPDTPVSVSASVSASGSNLIGNPGLDLQSTSNQETFLGDSSCWSSGNGWPDLAIYTPGSNFQ